jgi:hypothetical protein
VALLLLCGCSLFAGGVAASIQYCKADEWDGE